MNKLIKYGDMISAILVLIALFKVETNPVFWFVYVVGCLGFIFVGYKKRLYGLITMNAIAIILAIRNFLI